MQLVRASGLFLIDDGKFDLALGKIGNFPSAKSNFPSSIKNKP